MFYKNFVVLQQNHLWSWHSHWLVYELPARAVGGTLPQATGCMSFMLQVFHSGPRGYPGRGPLMMGSKSTRDQDKSSKHISLFMASLLTYHWPQKPAVCPKWVEGCGVEMCTAPTPLTGSSKPRGKEVWVYNSIKGKEQKIGLKLILPKKSYWNRRI